MCVCERVWLAERGETQEDEEEKKLEQAAEAAAAEGEVAEKLAAALSALKKQAASSTHALLLINLYCTDFCARRAGAASPLPPGCKRRARSRCGRLPVPACTHTHCRRLLLIHACSYSLPLSASLACRRLLINRSVSCTFSRRDLTVTSLRPGEKFEVKQ